MHKDYKLAAQLGRSVTTLENWKIGRHPPPVYLPLALEAIASDLAPAPPSTMQRANLVALLGVPAPTERHWKRANDFPRVACLALAAATSRALRELTKRDKDALEKLYWSGGARKYGKLWQYQRVPFRCLQASTVDPLIASGHLAVTAKGLKLTRKGRRHAIETMDKKSRLPDRL